MNEGRQPDVSCSAWAEQSQSPRDTAMWCLRILFALLGLALGHQVEVHLQEAGAPLSIQVAKRVERQGVEPPPTSEEQTGRPCDNMTPLHGGSRAAATRISQADGQQAWMHLSDYGPEDKATNDPQGGELDVASFMQEDVESLWHQLLDEIRLKLEGLGKGERSQTAAHMLRLLNHRATDTMGGQYLGHMQGRTAMLTALLVAMWDDEVWGVKIPAGDEKLSWLRPVWERITRFIERHPGSMEAAGRWPSHDLPCIMPATSHAPLPMPRSPIRLNDSYEGERPPPAKRRVLQVELSSSSSDPPRAVRLEVPLQEDGGC